MCYMDLLKLENNLGIRAIYFLHLDEWDPRLSSKAEVEDQVGSFHWSFFRVKQMFEVFLLANYRFFASSM